jgi:hypothetical protein
MAAKETITLEVKSDIKDVSKDASGLASEFKIMGVSLNSVKASLSSVGKVAKASFATIRAGIMSTGIGALLIAFTSLATFFTKTKKGAELLETAFAGVGAAVNVIVDRVSKFGGAIVKLFQGDTKGALKDVKGAFTGIGEEIIEDTKNAIALKQAFISLRDSERDLNVETAQRRADIEALKLTAEDTTKTEKERLAAAQAAFKIENDLLDKRIANAEEALRIQREEMALGENMAEDLDKEAELLINLANIRQESTTKQIELNNKINQINNEQRAKEEAAAAEKKKAEDEAEAERLKKAEEREAERKKMEEEELEDAKILAEKKKKLEDEVQAAKLQAIDMGFGAAEALAEESDAASKAVAVAKTIYNTQQAIMNAMANVPAPFNVAQAIATGVMGAKAIQNILSTSPSSTGGSSVPTASANTPAPQMMSGAFSLGEGMSPEPLKAFVVTDEMTNSQNQLANIRRRATI